MLFDKKQFQENFTDKLLSLYGKLPDEATEMDRYMALGSVIKDYISRDWAVTNRHYLAHGVKQAYYFSIEFLTGRVLAANLTGLGIKDQVAEALDEMGIALTGLERCETDMGLGSGGLGRLAACFLDSLAAGGWPGHASGIRYKYGQFEQKIIDGQQVELPDFWLKNGNVWETRKQDKAVLVKFGGTIREEAAGGRRLFIHENYEPVLAVPYDLPVIGYHNHTVNTLRLWNAEAAEDRFDFTAFNRGEYQKIIDYKCSVESISEILYPDDSQWEGRLLRLKQEYFLVSAGVASIVRRFKKKNGSLAGFADRIAIHINDTHPALAVPELMRILMDEEGMGWDEAWRVTTNTISYTNHTILPEAMEKWPEEMFRTLLPRIYMIVHEINEQFCAGLWKRWPGDWARIAAMAVIADGQVNMAHLAVVGSHSVNGVAKIHTEILKKQVLHNFYDYTPYKFNNKTNGITQRRWLLQANPFLARVINPNIGESWQIHPTDLIRLNRFAGDPAFQQLIARVKLHNKRRLARFIREKYSLNVNADAIFDVQIKRIHGYKRQLMNILHILDLYNRLRDDPGLAIVPRVFIFAGKASPSYYNAKRVIKLIHAVAAMVNNDPAVGDRLKVVFLENYNVSLAELIIPAADVSEQISTASKEASGTGNMKFMLNGAVMLGTRDGANIEIIEEVGEDNVVSFGMTADEVIRYYQQGGYCSRDLVNSDMAIKRVVNQLINGFLPAGRDEFRSLYASLVDYNDQFFVLKDFNAYCAAQERISRLYQDVAVWRRMCIRNIGAAGHFSSDRAIAEYAAGVWQLERQTIE